MAMPSSSSIRVFVRWKEQTVFAGEDIECEITFRNVDVAPTSNQASPHNASNAFQPGGHRKIPSAQIKGSSLNPLSANAVKGHRSTLSLTVPSHSSRSPVISGSWPSRQSVQTSRDAGKHKRSLSIISIAANENIADEKLVQNGHVDRVRPIRGHGRSASLQIVPRGLASNGISTAGKGHSINDYNIH